MRVLVTGGDGFVGRHLVDALAARGDEPIVAALHGDGEHALPFDLADPQSVSGVVEFVRPDAIVHLAAQTFVPQAIRDPLPTYDINALGTARLLEAIRAVRQEHGEAIRLVHASTGEVYGSREREAYPLRETLAPHPANPYAASKAAAEAAVVAAVAAYDLDAVIARPFNHIGPGQDERFAVSSFAHQLARIGAGAEPVMQIGNLDAQRDLLDVRDVVAAYLALLDRGVTGEIYNVCSGRAIAMRDVLRDLVLLARVPVEMREDPERMRPSDTPLFVGDPAKIEAQTGWRPQRALTATLRDILDDARERISA